jgi:nucleoside 2-deoxyribosyltransferase
LVTIDGETLKRLDEGRFTDPSIGQKLETIVRLVAERTEEFGKKVEMQPESDYPLATCRSATEWRELSHAATRLGRLSGTADVCSVTLEGWEWLTARPAALSSKGFIAMAFAPELLPLKDAIRKGIRGAGYEPARVDEEEYVGGVMDRIIALIRESRFVVADFTRNRGGVYYEAGFAFGLGIKVVQVCSQAQLDSKDPSEQLHFDVNHLNCLTWTDGKLDEFSDRLRDRILAIFGRGPIKEADGAR